MRDVFRKLPISGGEIGQFAFRLQAERARFALLAVYAPYPSSGKKEYGQNSKQSDPPKKEAGGALTLIT
jgi:hypothetical protein